MTVHTQVVCSDVERAIKLFDIVINRPKEGPPYFGIHNLSRSTLAKAYSASCHAHWRLFEDTYHGDMLHAFLRNEDIYVAASNANDSAALGLPSRTVIFVATQLLELGLKFLKDVRTHWRSSDFTALWNALSAYEKHQVKIARTPNAYKCAAEDCWVGRLDTVKKENLRRCAGECPPELKPSYCSNERQRWVSCTA